jgi:hypothetical protein
VAMDIATDRVPENCSDLPTEGQEEEHVRGMIC